MLKICSRVIFINFLFMAIKEDYTSKINKDNFI